MSTASTVKTLTIKPFGGVPDVVISIEWKDFQRYKYLVKKVSPNEVQWYSLVHRMVLDSSQRASHVHKDLYVYHISDMFIPEQEVSGTQVDTDVKKDPMKMYRLMQEIESRYANDSELGFDQDKANETIQAMHCWCHSHPFTGNPSPSGQDDNMFREWVEENQLAQDLDSPMVALIFGSGDKVHARVYDPQIPSIQFDNVRVHVDHDFEMDTTYMDEAVKNKIKKRTYGQVGWRGAAAARGASPAKGTVTIAKPKVQKVAGTPINNTNKQSSSHGWTRCSDGIWRKNEEAIEFEAEAKAKKEAKETQGKMTEERAHAFFSKHFPGNWTDLLHKANSQYQNEKEIQEIWNFVKHWLGNDVEQTLFATAMTDFPENLRKQADEDLKDMYVFPEEDILLVLLGQFSTDTMCSLQLKASLTFAKRYAKQTDKAGRLRAIKELEEALQTIEHQNLVWDKMSMEAQEQEEEEEATLEALVQNLGHEAADLNDDHFPAIPWEQADEQSEAS